MKKCSLMRSTLLALVLGVPATLLHAATITTPVTGWMVHNDGASGGTVVGGTPSAPTFTPGDNSTLMAPFTDVKLSSDGDFVEAKTTLTMTGRTGTGINTLNTQIRFALLDSSNATLTPGDASNLGYTIEYANLNGTPLTREQTSAVQTNPFTSPTTISPATITLDPSGGSIQGANPGAVTFDIKLTRNNGALDMVASVSGTDSVTSTAYLETFSWTGHTSANFPLNGAFTFNRLGIFLGGNANSATATLAESTVSTNVPEPATLLLAVGLAAVGGIARKRAVFAS